MQVVRQIKIEDTAMRMNDEFILRRQIAHTIIPLIFFLLNTQESQPSPTGGTFPKPSLGQRVNPWD